MPASLYPPSNPASLSLGNLDLMMMAESSSSANGFEPASSADSRAAAEQIALQLALLQQQGQQNGQESSHHNLNGHQAHGMLSASDLLNGHGASSGSMEDLKSTQRRSQNMTECVPVPSSEHVAEIVGRQGCKIKALRAKTNTYIKTPVRGEEPVFVVTGRKEDVALAKREILSAADHFSQIRASRKSNINSTLAFGQLMANTPGQTTVQVRVPYRVVGLVVGPKGATIKRIQQQTHTYIVTPSRDKEPVFEVTGLPENVEAARKEIEAHIAIRTGTTDFGGSSSSNMYFNMNENNVGNNGDNDLFSTSGGLNSPFSSSSGNLDHVNSILNSDSNGFASFKSNGITLANLLGSSNNFGENDSGSSGGRGGGQISWSNGTDSHDSGIGHSPPFDGNGLGNHGSGSSSAFKNFMPSSGSNNSGAGDSTLNGIWGELNKVLGGLDLSNNGHNGQHHDSPTGSGSSANNEINKQFLNIGSRSSLDLGTLGRPLTSEPAVGLSSAASLTTNNTANNSTAMGRQLSLPTDSSTSSTTTSLPGFNGILSSSSDFNKADTKDQDALDMGASAANE